MVPLLFWFVAGPGGLREDPGSPGKTQPWETCRGPPDHRGPCQNKHKDSYVSQGPLLSCPDVVVLLGGKFQFFKDRNSVILGVWAAPGAPETLAKGGGLRPPPFARVSKSPGATQTLKITDFQSLIGFRIFNQAKVQPRYAPQNQFLSQTRQWPRNDLIIGPRG